MLLVIESVVLCIIFTLVIIPPLYKNPIGQIMSYPTAIRKRVESLPEYKDSIKTEEKNHIIKKISGLFLFAIILAVVSYLSGATTFKAAFYHTFILLFIVNMYDLLILDLILFCNNKKVIIKGTEDMIKEYKSPKHHIKGTIIGTCFGGLVGVMAGLLITLFNCII